MCGGYSNLLYLYSDITCFDIEYVYTVENLVNLIFFCSCYRAVTISNCIHLFLLFESMRYCDYETKLFEFFLLFHLNRVYK